MAPSGRCKLDRVVEEYGLHDVDPRHESVHEGLVARWRGDGGHDAVGYRTLTEWFNRRLLWRVCADRGRETAGGRVEHDYEVLTGEDDLRRGEVMESLRADGVEAEQVLEDMVSWGTMRTHLTDCLDGEKAHEGGEWERDTVEMARSFAREKVESAVSSLATKGKVDGVDRATVSVQVHLQCEDCPTRVPLDVALERGYVCRTHSESR